MPNNIYDANEHRSKFDQCAWGESGGVDPSVRSARNYSPLEISPGIASFRFDSRLFACFVLHAKIYSYSLRKMPDIANNVNIFAKRYNNVIQLN